MISEERRLGRAKNAVLSFLEKKLSVPKIYMDATWAGQHVDVLAIDRDGVGDVHVVLLYGELSPLNSDDVDSMIDSVNDSLSPLIARLLIIPAQYKYIGAVNLGHRPADPLPGIPHASVDRSYDPHGIGRIGFLSIDAATEEELRTKVVFKPERFRAKVADLADEYMQINKADWEIRA